jgi:hypothetical protein
MCLIENMLFHEKKKKKRQKQQLTGALVIFHLGILLEYSSIICDILSLKYRDLISII